jgi:hypothetical protein
MAFSLLQQSMMAPDGHIFSQSLHPVHFPSSTFAT